VELAPPSEALARPWRKATIVATAVAALELVLLVAAGIALLGRDLAHHGRKAEPTAAKPHAAAVKQRAKPPLARPQAIGKARLSRAATSVLVLNGNGRAGAAATQATMVSGRGYRLVRVGNAPRSDYTRSVVMYRPGYRAEAARLAHDVGISLFGPLDGLTPASLGTAQLAVVVGTG
jgi:hypothetical protein